MKVRRSGGTEIRVLNSKNLAVGVLHRTRVDTGLAAVAASVFGLRELTAVGRV